MGYSASIIICIFAIIVCLIALVANVVAGHFIWALIMIVCIVFNLIALLRLYSAGRYL